MSEQGDDSEEIEPDEDDTAEEERRLFGDRRQKVTAFVGAALGLTRVEVAADRIGQFSLIERGAVNCVAADESVVVGTEETVLVGDGERFNSVDFGPAATVGVDEGYLYAASPDGEVGRLALATVADGTEGIGDRWERVGSVDDPARFGGSMLAAADGLYQVDDELEHHGLADVRDVTPDGTFAATADGIYRFDGEWHREYEGAARAVQTHDGTVYAIAGGEDSGAGSRLVKRNGDEWRAVDLPTTEELVDLAVGQGLYVLTDQGTLIVEADPAETSDGHAGWRSRALGVRDARRLAVAP